MFIKLLLTSFFCLITNLTIAADLKIATTTSTESSGLLDVLIPAFEKDSGYKVKIFSVGTGTALRLGRQGKVDVLLVHAPPAEKKFISDGYGVLRTHVMKNDFIIAGPKNDPAKIHALKDANLAFTNIQTYQSSFISRADDSGTHKKENSIWKASKIQPYGDWYYEAGTGMGAAVEIANTQSAYILIDRGTWLAKRKNTDLILHVKGDPLLVNPYHVIAINPVKYPQTKFKAAKKFIRWITNKHGQSIITQLKVNGEQLFTGAIK